MTSTEQVGLVPREAAHPFWAAILLGSLLFIPGAFGFLFEGLSFATGTALVSIVAILLLAAGQIPSNARDIQSTLAIAAMASFVILVHLLIAYVIDHDPQFDFGRALLSLALIALIIFAIPATCDGIMALDDRLSPIVKTICALFALIALLSLLQIQPATSSLGAKPTFPYTEPSFLGFSMPAVLIFTMVRSPTPIRMAVLVVFLVLGYLLSNFTIIAVCALAAVVTLPLSWFAAGIAVILASLASLDLTYYTDRLNFDWASSTNLSSLVYVQGWQMLQESISRTYAWGLGFQQLGIVYTNVPASFRINMVLGYDLNLQDGGFILSKVISEFGIVGMALVGAYLYVAIKAFFRLRSVSKGLSRYSSGEVFACSCVMGYFIELTIRGTNYFTGTFVLMLCGILYMTKRRRVVAIHSAPVLTA
jgi:hypothetical protein